MIGTNDMEHRLVEIWTDGACIPNPGRGSWAWLNDLGQERYGTVENSTNNRMELEGIIRALEFHEDKATKLIIHSDSEYCVNGLNTWIHNWLKKGWFEKGKVKNPDLWLKLHELRLNREIELRWVKGHSGDLGNDRADELTMIALGIERDQFGNYQINSY